MFKLFIALPYIMATAVIGYCLASLPAALATDHALAVCDALENRYDRGACYSEMFTR